VLEDDRTRCSLCDGLLRHVEEVAHVGSWGWDPRSDEWCWSDNLYRLFGIEPGAVRPSVEYAVRRAHPGDRSSMLAAASSLRSDAPFRRIRYRVLMPAGDLRHHEAALAPDDGVGDHGLCLGTVRDITDSWRANREIAAHVAVHDALAGQGGPTGALERLLDTMGRALGFQRGVVWVPVDTALVPRHAWSVEPRRDLLAELRHLRLEYGSGLAGRAWKERAPVGTSDASGLAGYDFREAAETECPQGAVAIPAIARDEVLAVLGFASGEPLEMTERLQGTLTGISHEIGEFLARRRPLLAPRTLTRRELEVLQLAANGATGNAIAQRLVVSPSTVKTHFENIYRKLDVPDRAAAVACGFRAGLIS
jgi:DNA-binding CsgD family transcriptional regulator